MLTRNPSLLKLLRTPDDLGGNIRKFSPLFGIFQVHLKIRLKCLVEVAKWLNAKVSHLWLSTIKPAADLIS
jgi:hypothetical protein